MESFMDHLIILPSPNNILIKHFTPHLTPPNHFKIKIIPRTKPPFFGRALDPNLLYKSQLIWNLQLIDISSIRINQKRFYPGTGNMGSSKKKNWVNNSLRRMEEERKEVKGWFMKLNRIIQKPPFDIGKTRNGKEMLFMWKRSRFHYITFERERVRLWDIQITSSAHGLLFNKFRIRIRLLHPVV